MSKLIKITHRSGIGEFFEFLEKVFDVYSIECKVVITETPMVNYLFSKVFESDSILFDDHPKYMLQIGECEEEIFVPEEQFRDRPREYHRKVLYTENFTNLPKVLKLRKDFKCKAKEIIETLDIVSKVGIHLRHDPLHPGDSGPYHYYKVRESLKKKDKLNVFLCSDNYFYKELITKDFPMWDITEYPKQYTYSKKDSVELYSKFDNKHKMRHTYEAVLEATILSQCKSLYLNPVSSFSNMTRLFKELYDKC